MEKYKLKFTRLENEIFQLLCIKVGISLNQRTIAKLLNVSPTAVAKSIKDLEREELAKVEKSKTMNLILIELNRESSKAIALKRTENLKQIYKFKLAEFLEEKFPGCAIVLFGSYCFGEDTIKSDIDIAIIGSKPKEVNLEKFNKLLERTVIIQFYNDLKSINKNLRENIINGIIIGGRL